MPFPALSSLLIPALFTGGSMLVNNLAAKKQDRAIAAANTAERLRQNRLDEEAFAINQTAQDRLEDFDEQQQGQASALGDIFREAAAEAPAKPMVGLPTSSSNVVNKAEQAAKTQTAADISQRADALAGMRSVGDLFGDIQAEQLRDTGNLAMLNSFKRGSQSALPLELDVASQAGSGLRLVGDLFNMAGGLTLNQALRAKPPGAS